MIFRLVAIATNDRKDCREVYSLKKAIL